MRGRQEGAPRVRVVEVPRPEPAAAPAVTARSRRSRRVRGATALAFTALFAAGGAFSALAGDAVVDDGTTLVAETPAPPAVDEPAPAPAETVAAAEPAPVQTVAEPDPADATPARPLVEPPAETPAAPAEPAPAASPRPATPPKPRHIARTAPAPEPAAPPAAPPFPVITFDPQSWLAGNAATRLGAAAVTIAEQYLGVPYVWGGNTPEVGFDCSGLTQFVYAQLGVSMPHYAASQFRSFPRVALDELRPGDLVFFEPKADGPGHVSLYAGGDRIIDAPHSGAVVRVASLTGMAQALGFLGGVRPQGDAPPAAPERAVPEQRPFVTPSPA